MALAASGRPMASSTIEAAVLDRLWAIRRPRESYSDVILRNAVQNRRQANRDTVSI